MLEQHTERIISVLTDRTIGQRDAISLKEFISSPIPLGIKSYIQAELARELRRELLVNPRFARVDVNATGMSSVLNGFIRSCALEYAFTHTEFVALIDQAVHFLGNYLCRPRWTLRHFVFEQADRLSVGAVRERLEYTADYEYFRRLLDGVVAHKAWTHITLDQFVDVVKKIDLQVMRQDSGRELAILTKPIFDFLVLANPPGVDTIPMKPVTLFFADKEQTVLKEYIENVCKLRGRDELSLVDLIGMLDELEAAQQPVEAQQSLERDVPSTDETPIADSSSQDIVPEIPAEVVQAEESVEQEQQSLFEDRPDQQADIQAEQQAGANIHKDRRNLALSLTFSGISERQTVPKLPPLASTIPDEQQALFIKELFGKDASYYAGVIDALENTPNWKDASMYLNQFFHMNGLDPYADVVIQFTDVIHQRYNQEPSPNI
ncbi:MAG: hypothetical protein ACKVRP_02180 [Bacteroidota bacterium]